jgi:hypothetical protein
MNRAILGLTLVLAGCASMHQPKRSGILFSELQSGDRVHICFASTGCFHSNDYDFEFKRGGATTVRVASLSRSSWNAARKSFQYHSPKRLGTLTLTPREIAGLDRLVRFYRTHPDASCTTTDDITIEHFKRIYGPSSPAIASEHYLDGSCEADKLPGVTTLPSLAKRLETNPE